MLAFTALLLQGMAVRIVQFVLKHNTLVTPVDKVTMLFDFIEPLLVDTAGAAQLDDEVCCTALTGHCCRRSYRFLPELTCHVDDRAILVEDRSQIFLLLAMVEACLALHKPHAERGSIASAAGALPPLLPLPRVLPCE